MVAALQGLLGLLGRVMLCAIFIYSVVMDKVPNFERLSVDLAARGIAQPKIVLGAVIGFIVFGSVLVIVGYWARLGALLLLATLGCITYWMYPFWTIEDLAARHEVMTQFIKNVSIGGAMVMILANGGGVWSIDCCWAEEEEEVTAAPPAKAKI